MNYVDFFFFWYTGLHRYLNVGVCCLEASVLPKCFEDREKKKQNSKVGVEIKERNS